MPDADAIDRAAAELEEELPPVSGNAGDVIAGKYRLERVIGRGAMGTVWEAVHLGLEDHVAVKLVANQYAQSREARYRFKVEATAAAKLRSRFAVQVYDSGETEGGVPYLAMERLEGETLENRLTQEGALSLLDTVRVASQVGRGLMRAHALGIVHRDLKPANIFLARSGDDEAGYLAKVLDFGIAKMIDKNDTSTTRTGTVLGTPQFMSPEQVRGLKSLDHRADLYALGAVVFNMLTGKIAFEGEAFGDLLLSICTKPLPNVTTFAPDLPPSLDDWFHMACAREPEFRFQHADEMVDALYAASGLEDGSIREFVAGGATMAHGTITDSMRPPPPAPAPAGDEDGLPTLKRDTTDLDTSPLDGDGSSGVHTLGSGGTVRPLWPVVAGTAFIALLGLGVFTLAFSGGKKPRPDGPTDGDPAAVSAAPATAAPGAILDIDKLAADAAATSDAGAASGAEGADSEEGDIDSGADVTSDTAPKKKKRRHRWWTPPAPTPSTPKKPDLGF